MKELKKDLHAAGVSVPLGKWLYSANLNLLACQTRIPTIIKKKKPFDWEEKVKRYPADTL